MSDKINFTGKILVSPPMSQDGFFSKGVVFVAKDNHMGTWGLMVNKPTDKITLDMIMKSTGIFSSKQDKIYFGGPVDTQRVHVLHTLDWSINSTMVITKDIGITNDVSVLAAISRDSGPALFRVCLGVSSWAPGQLLEEYYAEPPRRTQDSWLDAPSSIETVFHLSHEEQWEQAIEHVAKNKINSWL